MPQPYKDSTAAWLFWFFLGSFGAHDFYLRRTGQAVTMLVLTVVGWLTAELLIGFIPLFVVFVLWVVDACSMSSRLQQTNQSIHAANVRLQLPPAQW